MIWTLLVFGLTMFLLAKLAFPRIGEALDRRQQAIEEAIDTAEHTRREADQLLAEYRERLTDARHQADDIVARARKAGEQQEADAVAKGEGAPGGAPRAGPPRHRGGDAAGDPGDPRRGRRPHRHGHGEGDAQDAHRPRTSGGSSTRRWPSWTSPRCPGSGRSARPWRRSPPSTPARCSRRRTTRTSSTRCASSSASSPTRSTATAGSRSSSSRPTSPPRRRWTACGGRSTVPSRSSSTSSSCCWRTTACRRSSASGASTTGCGRSATSSCRCT